MTRAGSSTMFAFGAAVISTMVGMHAEAATYAVLHSFRNDKSHSGPAYPFGSLVYYHGRIYGVSKEGAYSIKPGKEAQLLGSGVGSDLDSGLVNGNGIFYGTTLSGGSANAGSVNFVTTDGTEGIVYSFTGGSDGASPVGGVIYSRGVLYGTTANGGSGAKRRCPGGQCGTAFSLTLNGSKTILHTFQGRKDGAIPVGSLLKVGNTLYGTTCTFYGTYDDSCGGYGGGTVFSVTPGAEETVLHRFENTGDGSSPHSGMTDVSGVFYGTTLEGGKSSYCPYTSGCGTVYAITPAGSERVLYSFQDLTDGSFPEAGLVNANGVLYGTTSAGETGYGTIYSVTLAGVETDIHDFVEDGKDGLSPSSPLLNVGGTLYGTTQTGGTYNQGTLFSVTQ